EDAADLAKPFFDVGFGEDAPAAQPGKRGLQFFGKLVEHRLRKLADRERRFKQADVRYQVWPVILSRDWVDGWTGGQVDGAYRALSRQSPGMSAVHPSTCPPVHLMAKTQRKDDILKSELPPSLPLMALRSTIVYPLGTIAVQMGAPENLALLRANEQSGL